MLCNYGPPRKILNFANFRVKLSWKEIRISERIYTPELDADKITAQWS